jgi:two-component system sensor histidine kinase KdpD
MSRLQAGAMALAIQPIDVADVISTAVTSLGPATDEVIIRVPEETPEVQADPALLERAGAYGAAVKIRAIDRGPGVPETDWDQIFQPFQRLEDRDNTSGVGLGLATSRVRRSHVGNSEPGWDPWRRLDNHDLAARRR